jgi:hypothetical protein
MMSTAHVVAFLFAGALLANATAAFALSHRPTWQRLLAPAFCFGLWLSASLLLDRNWLSAELGGHAAAVAAAIFCISGSPVFVIRRWNRR